MAANRYIASRDFTWADAGIHASSRVINRKFDLDRNYRNTAEILRAARTFSVPGSGMQGVLALPVEPDTAIRSGPGLLSSSRDQLRVRIRLLKWTPPANYGRVFDPATVPAWAMPMHSLAVAVAAGKPPPWVLPVLRSPSWRAAA